MKILMILASKDFRDIEYIVPRSFFEQNNYTIKTAASSPISYGKFGYTVKNDVSIDQVKVDDFEAICFVGGGGSLEYKNNPTAENLTKQFLAAGKVVAAICAAPQNLLHWGMLENKKCTGWNDDKVFENLCRKNGAHYTGKEIEIDGQIITGDGPKEAEIFALAIMEKLENG